MGQERQFLLVIQIPPAHQIYQLPPHRQAKCPTSSGKEEFRHPTGNRHERLWVDSGRPLAAGLGPIAVFKIVVHAPNSCGVSGEIDS